MNQNYYNQYNNPNNYYPNQFQYNQVPYQQVPNKKGVNPLIIVIIIVLVLVAGPMAFYLLNESDDNKKEEPKIVENEEKKDLELYGGWKTQSSDYETYWVFDGNEFWWYKSYNDLKDNYWYGTMTIETGREGLKSVGLNENAVDTILKNSKGNVTEEDIYTLTLTPKKIISGGVDKSSTNIPENSKWHYVWIVVDYDEQGFEGQVLNVDTNEVTYFQRSK